MNFKEPELQFIHETVDSKRKYARRITDAEWEANCPDLKRLLEQGWTRERIAVYMSERLLRKVTKEQVGTKIGNEGLRHLHSKKRDRQRKSVIQCAEPLQSSSNGRADLALAWSQEVADFPTPAQHTDNAVSSLGSALEPVSWPNPSVITTQPKIEVRSCSKLGHQKGRNSGNGSDLGVNVDQHVSGMDQFISIPETDDEGHFHPLEESRVQIGSAFDSGDDNFMSGFEQPATIQGFDVDPQSDSERGYCSRHRFIRDVGDYPHQPTNNPSNPKQIQPRHDFGQMTMYSRSNYESVCPESTVISHQFQHSDPAVITQPTTHETTTYQPSETSESQRSSDWTDFVEWNPPIARFEPTTARSKASRVLSPVPCEHDPCATSDMPDPHPSSEAQTKLVGTMFDDDDADPLYGMRKDHCYVNQ